MIIIKGNLTINERDKLREYRLRQAQGIPSETSSDEIEINTENIVAFADLDTFDISAATIFIGDVELSQIDSTLTILVTNEVISHGY